MARSTVSDVDHHVPSRMFFPLFSICIQSHIVGTELVIVGVVEGSGVLADGLVADQRKPEALSEHEPRFLELATEGSARLEEGLLAEARSELG